MLPIREQKFLQFGVDVVDLPFMALYIFFRSFTAITPRGAIGWSPTARKLSFSSLVREALTEITRAALTHYDFLFALFFFSLRRY